MDVIIEAGCCGGKYSWTGTVGCGGGGGGGGA